MLQVLSAPQNQPSLNPKVQPVSQPAFSPRVTTPTQPAFNSQVQSRPRTIGHISTIGTADYQQPYTQKLSLDEFAQTIKQKYPEYADRDNTVLAQAMLAKYPQYQNRVFIPQAEESPGERGLKGFGLGAVKGALNTVSNITGLASKVPAPLGALLPPLTGLAVANKKLEPHKENFQPQGTAEKLGFGAEQVGEFFLPAGLAGKAAKATQLGRLGTLSALAGTEAATTFGVSKLQGQSTKNAATNAAIAGAFPVAGALIKPITTKLSSRLINSLIKPRELDFRFGKNPGLAVAEEGITGNSIQALAKNISSVRRSIGKQIDRLLNQPEVATKVQNISPAFQPIDDAIEKAVQRGEQDFVTRLIQFRDGITKDYRLVKGKLVEQGVKKLDLSPKEIQLLKTQVGEGTRWTGQAFDSDVNRVKVQVYQRLNDLVENVVPGSKKVNAHYANLLTAEKAAERRANTLTKQNLVSLPNFGVGGAFGAAVGLGSGAALPGLAAAGAGIAASKALGSTAVKSRAAKQLANPTSLGLTRKLYFGTRFKKERSR